MTTMVTSTRTTTTAATGIPMDKVRVLDDCPFPPLLESGPGPESGLESGPELGPESEPGPGPGRGLESGGDSFSRTTVKMR